jgi:polyferredoxin
MYESLVGTILAAIVVIGIALAGALVIVIWKKDRTRKLSYLRFFIQVFSVVVIFFSFTLWLLVLLIAIIAVTSFSGRFFCGWICPFGLYMDIISEVRKALKVRYFTLPERINKALNKARYAIAAVILAMPLFMGALTTPALRIYIMYLTGPLKPLDLFLGPLEPLILPARGAGTWGLSYPYMRDITFDVSPAILATIYVYIFVILTVTATFMYRRFWCRFCPTGITIAALNRFKAFKWMPLLHINKVEEKCTKCGICKRVCPVQVTDVYEQKGGDIRSSMCLNCMRCIEMCPYEGCLKMNLAGKTVFQSRNWLEPSIDE